MMQTRILIISNLRLGDTLGGRDVEPIGVVPTGERGLGGSSHVGREVEVVVTVAPAGALLAVAAAAGAPGAVVVIVSPFFIPRMSSGPKSTGIA